MCGIFADAVAWLNKYLENSFFIDFLERRLLRDLGDGRQNDRFIYTLTERGLIRMERVLQFILAGYEKWKQKSSRSVEISLDVYWWFLPELYEYVKDHPGGFGNGLKESLKGYDAGPRKTGMNPSRIAGLISRDDREGFQEDIWVRTSSQFFSRKSNKKFIPIGAKCRHLK
jgi:hypothetical protein